ncbi:hypothetical protein BAUCODRAFT_110894 [Baudoinia panamericana UAMH 10762]|uniref:Alpha/beta hydrolase fold-3 domain-containing protein n=1 Tax=Baudoinia panamericana (strain UAMH 10762) TaxID=717646 RepID=M2N8I2_BAUPA|nr:uncharacterized protein BAUCODRAFT_110894 [Baudoinia panamericana UAMH 10762]EMC95409.1 hypothetical protein BAUCODRAFT_110894 [Baudoinia panamericana UAMH 10762]
MIDHVLGRPNTRFRKYQVFTVVLLWSLYLYKGNPDGPRPLRRLSQYLTKRLTTWRQFVIFCLSLYVARNFARVVGLESPEPLENLYSSAYFRATWITTALDAGFWTAMHLRPKWLKDLASVIFTVYYLFCAEQADEMVRRVRGALTLQHLRVSWNKAKTPYLSAVTSLLRPKEMTVKPHRLRIHRPEASSYKEPIMAWLYYPGTSEQLQDEEKIVLDIPGGGFVAMDPRCHDDKLMAWAAKLRLPVLALDYKKAPDQVYPYALNECYDAYWQIIESNGRCLGLSGSRSPKVVLSGDSAGGNLATGLMCMLLSESPYGGWNPGDRAEHGALPVPEALVLIYPALDMNISNWMTDEQTALLVAPERRRAHKGVISRKSDDYRRLTHDTPYASTDDFNRADDEERPKMKHSMKSSRNLSTSGKPPTRLQMRSMISYFNDRILSPEMLRAMIIMYIGPHNKPDFATDHLLSPILTPENILERFPKTYFLTGERDPLSDDTIIMVGRLRQAHLQRFRERQELGIIPASERFDDSKHVEEMLIPEISHGFLQFVGVYPEGRKYIELCSSWMKQAFDESDARDLETPVAERRSKDYFARSFGTRHHSRTGTAGSEVDERPLEIPGLSMTPIVADAAKRKASSGKGRIHKRAGGGSGARSPLTTRRSFLRLTSGQDFMARRMNSVTSGLIGDAIEPMTP